MRLAPVLALLLSSPAAAFACGSVLQSAAGEVEMGSGLNPSTLRQVRDACGDAGPASLVATLVARGACDHAAQLARSLPGQLGMEGALAAADACLAGQVGAMLDDLELAAAGEEEDASRREMPASEPERRSRSDRDARAKSVEASSAPLGGLGSLGEGSGGAGGLGRSGTGFGDLAAASPRRDSNAGPRASTRAPARNAATGVGTWVGRDERIAGLEANTQVAWSRLSFSIWFDTDSASLSPEALGTIGALARNLELDEGTVLQIVGHTDSTGAWGYNLDLSERRARSVRQALTLAGLPAGHLAVVGRGEDEPVATNIDGWGRAQNRRVEFRFFKPVAQRLFTR